MQLPGWTARIVQKSSSNISNLQVPKTKGKRRERLLIVASPEKEMRLIVALVLSDMTSSVEYQWHEQAKNPADLHCRLVDTSQVDQSSVCPIETGGSWGKCQSAMNKELGPIMVVGWWPL